MKMKPIPKMILILAIAVAAGYGVMHFLPKQKQNITPPAEQPVVVAPPTEVKTPPPNTAVPVAAPQPAAPQEPAPGLTPAGGVDAGLDAVLKAGKK